MVTGSMNLVIIGIKDVPFILDFLTGKIIGIITGAIIGMIEDMAIGMKNGVIAGIKREESITITTIGEIEIGKEIADEIEINKIGNIEIGKTKMQANNGCCTIEKVINGMAVKKVVFLLAVAILE